jgi:GNAT superfamily N-acetyltransferase
VTAARATPVLVDLPAERPGAGRALERLGDVVDALTRKQAPVRLAPLQAGQVEELYALFADVVARGDGYPHTPPLTRPAFEETWVRPVTVVVGATVEGRLAGAYYLKPNGPGLAAHVANAGYLVDRLCRGEGIGEALVADSVERAPLAGFDAVQFNWVFESNPARALYERHGWIEVGRIPDAVARPDGKREAALVYWRSVG